MHSSEASTLTQANTLRVELEYVGQLGEKEVHPRDIGVALDSLGWLSRVAYAIGMQGETFSLEAIEKNQWLEPRIVRLRFGSPFVSVTEVADPILGSVAAMSAVIYGLKRLWNLRVEFETHSKLMEARFLDAEAKALEAELRKNVVMQDAKELAEELKAIRHRENEASRDASYEAHVKAAHARLDADGERVRNKVAKDLGELDIEFGWPEGTARGLDGKVKGGWKGRSALWLGEQPEVGSD